MTPARLGQAVLTRLRRLRARLAGHGETLRLAAAALLLGACFLQPRWPATQHRVDLVVVFDVTQSMNVADVLWAQRPVPRLVLAKRLWHDALLRLPCGSRIGWGLFTEYRSFLLLAPVEVCANLGELRATLAHIDGRMAWSGNSEIAKGLYSGLAVAAALPERPGLVFVSDGQEAPPLDARHRPSFPGRAGEVAGLVLGVGQPSPSPIPKLDPAGRPIGTWGADEVAQTDPRSRGRAGSVSGEAMADTPGTRATPMLGATPGSEHLSGLREAYLRLLAGETGLHYRTLHDAEGLHEAIGAAGLTQPLDAPLDLRPACALLALALLLAGPLAGPLSALRLRRAAGRGRPPARRLP
ncbi:VWA domain-containing protein [Piscinibacter sakaiensis]|uniref:MxaL protein n=1 Tax=Piscinibacter sakaiensis TaxID=1547922 RepID=A0A0K8NVG0_PISS1|nr:VWA domain-containing protein [Piscinibacter sakaiensis]GAP33925.1 MxaL protein [Piscinibacter sakaiensis]